MLIKACLNGSREPGALDALPLSPNELARAAQSAIVAGAGALHIHPRRADGTQSFAAEDCGAAFAAVRASCPGTSVGGTTAAWIEPDVQRRQTLIQAWQILPDFVSVNFSEAGTAELCTLLLAKGIGVEAGLATIDDARLLLTLGIADRCTRLLFEPGEQEMGAALAVVDAIERVLDDASVQTSKLLHGFEATAWPLLEVALQRGYDTRIGLEDTLHLPDGRQARDNAQLVSVAYERAQQAGRI
ncbi:MAG: 3-keto-5-aminohexanoate cleavage protein [Chloroflexota bacterium]|nr:3-keto-5-aminohexanoate cleavage protein [Chloroflexota bacterium]